MRREWFVLVSGDKKVKVEDPMGEDYEIQEIKRKTFESFDEMKGWFFKEAEKRGINSRKIKIEMNKEKTEGVFKYKEKYNEFGSYLVRDRWIECEENIRKIEEFAEILKNKFWIEREYNTDADRIINLWQGYLKLKIKETGEVRMYSFWEVFDFGIAKNRVKRWKKDENGELIFEPYYNFPVSIYTKSKIDPLDWKVFEISKVENDRIQL